MAEPVELRVETAPDRVSVYRHGSTTPILVQNAAADLRAHIHPIMVPGGSVSVTEDAPDHHPWQHGLYVGFNDVNGAGFWHEKLHPHVSADDGSFHPRIVGQATASGASAAWAVGSDYRDKDGVALLVETQEWTFTDLGDHYVLDLVLTLHALTDLTFGRYDYGGLFVRMPFRTEIGGLAYNSEGLTNSEAEGQRATWVATQMPIPGLDEEVTVVITDHPDNREHPVPWRVDNELGVVPSVSIAGAWHLSAGDDEVFRHRVVVYPTPVESTVVDATWLDFTKGRTA
jgi:hypothetical protein